MARKSKPPTSSILLRPSFTSWEFPYRKIWTAASWLMLSARSSSPERPVTSGAASGTSGDDRPSGYTDEESAKVEERLQALGYLE